jgi:hypothetical protein
MCPKRWRNTGDLWKFDSKQSFSSALERLLKFSERSRILNEKKQAWSFHHCQANLWELINWPKKQIFECLKFPCKSHQLRNFTAIWRIYRFTSSSADHILSCISWSHTAWSNRHTGHFDASPDSSLGICLTVKNSVHKYLSPPNRQKETLAMTSPSLRITEHAISLSLNWLSWLGCNLQLCPFFSLSSPPVHIWYAVM